MQFITNMNQSLKVWEEQRNVTIKKFTQKIDEGLFTYYFNGSFQ